MFDGKGKFTYAFGGHYEGEFVKNLRHGKGILVFADGIKYEGNFV